MRVVVLPAIAILSACTVPGARPEPVSPSISLSFAADSLRSERIADGMARHFIYVASGPWAINVLDVSRSACYSAIAVKGFPNSIGRRKTSDLLMELDSSGAVVGGVNADFFAPNGRPTNAHISRGVLWTGPSSQPVLAFDSTGSPAIKRLTASALEGHGFGLVDNWNRPMPNGAAFFDSRWGPVTDSASNTIELVVEGPAMRIVQVDSAPAGVPIPDNGGVIIFRGRGRERGRDYRPSSGTNGLGWRMTVASRPTVMEAVGGRPVLIKDSVIVPEVDTEGAAGFATSRHPRTAVGIARNGDRLLLVTVDGRQKPYSDGMTLRELADLILALGARDAINLDGGGSTTLVYKDPRTKKLAIANKPSDPTGERAVGNALAIVRNCGSRPAAVK